MAITEDFQFDLNGYTFGYRMPISVDQAGFTPEAGETIDQDQINPATGARMMGRDVTSAGVWSWMMHMNTETDPYRIGGRTRVVFGRPRAFDYSLDNRLLGGYIPPSATFALSSPLHYDSNEQVVLMKLGTEPSEGLAFPAAMPFTFETVPGFVPSWQVKVAGDAPTAPIVKFTGPVMDPSVTIGTFELGFSGSLPEGASIEVDCRPWAHTMRRVGSSPDLAPSRDTRLNRALLQPGTYAGQYRGLDLSGKSSCQVRWRDAWVTL